MSARQPLYYTFGNHMHWVDMQWLWGYGVLPGSVRDMLCLVRETGARGNINFDAIGYEKMAAECPEALEELCRAIADGLIEPVGCSYGQPYGLFHGGESNIRQLTYGVRATRRLLGVRPRAFWEEEFYFFPQLPQLLAQCGYTGASLFFQWTWHTPEVPKEPRSLILWEGADGTRLPALPRNELNVHQWPEDFDGLLDKVADGSWRGEGAGDDQPPVVVQWLELMPSRDWMCRSEVLLPRLKELMGDPRFEVRARTLSGLIGELDRGSAPVRRYAMDEVWHGMTLGKNGDKHPRRSRAREEQLVAAEVVSAIAGLFGRPYPQWDVYPTWELEEAWRELLAAQHHDNHECEGLCGSIGLASYERSDFLSELVLDRGKRGLCDRVGLPAGRVLVFNPGGSDRDVDFYEPGGERYLIARNVPAFGYAVVNPGETCDELEPAVAERCGDHLDLRRGKVRVSVDPRAGVIRQICTTEFPSGLLHPDRPLLQFSMMVGGREERFEHAECHIREEPESKDQWIEVIRRGMQDAPLRIGIGIDGPDQHIAISVQSAGIARPEPGMAAGLRMPIEPDLVDCAVIANEPYSAGTRGNGASGVRKYPEGDWMTSPQWFERVENSITGLSWLDLIGRGGSGVHISHTGGQQFFRAAHGVVALLTCYDPWDESYFHDHLGLTLRLRTHGAINDGQRAEFVGRDAIGSGPVTSVAPPGDLPPAFGPLSVVGAPGVLAHAFFRESMKSGEHLPEWAGHRMFDASGGACDHPFVIRLVEWNGEPAEVELKLAGPVAMAAKTNLLGEVLADRYDPAAHAAAQGFSAADSGWLDIRHPVEPPAWAHHRGKPIEFQGRAITWSSIRFRMRPREIATIYADMVMGRKQWRDLDAKRKVWATVHKTPG